MNIPPELLRSAFEMLNTAEGAQMMHEHMASFQDKFALEDSDLVADFEKRRKTHITKFLPRHTVMTTTTPFAATKKAPRTSHALAPIDAASLALDTTHFGRVFRGTLCVDPIVINAMQTLVRDEKGHVVSLSVYGLFDMALPLLTRQALADTRFKKGTRVAVREPFFKVMADGTRSIRVDDPSEFSAGLQPQTASDHMKDGHELLRLKDANSALDTFRKALDLSADPNLVPILKNLSVAQLKLGQADHALAAAITATCVDPKDKKAELRVAAAMSRTSPPSKRDTVATVVDQAGHVELRTKKRVEKQDAAALKAAGNDAFKAGNFEQALGLYLRALNKCVGLEMVADALAGISLCADQLADRPAEVYLFDYAAKLLNASSASSGVRHVRALIALDMVAAADQLCRLLQTKETSDELEHLRIDLDSLLHVRSKPEPPTRAKTLYGPSEREMSEQKNYMNLEQTAMMNQMMEMAEATLTGPKKTDFVGKGLTLDHRIAAFHLEFSNTRVWPAECDKEAGLCALRMQYETGRACDTRRAAFIGALGETGEEILYALVKDMLPERLGHAPVKWFLEAPIGSIRHHDRFPYSNRILHSFQNAPGWSINAGAGRAHVSIGFNDLGELLRINICPTTSPGPLQFVGYDASEYSVSKSLVISEMLKDEFAGVDAILQVWYSAAWSRDTLACFRRALASLLAPAKNSPSPHVRALLVHWQGSSVTLRESRRLWLDNHSKSWAWIGTFRREADRLALCEYFLTGQILEADVGSVVMFAVPTSVGEVSFDENVLGTVHLIDPANSRDTLITDANVVESWTTLVRVRLSELKSRIQTRQIDITLHHQAVVPGDSTTIAAIRNLNPFTMNWSNVPDYFSPRDFFALAKSVSAKRDKDTVHHMYSMNWLRDVKGGFLIDYVPHVNMTRELVESSEKSHKELMAMLGFASHLHSPPVGNIANLVDYHLAAHHQRDWFRSFMAEAGLKNWERQSMFLGMGVVNPMSRTDSSLHFAFNFDPEVNFVKA
ncbi:hypothetical protein HDU98_010057 [Podochytrium sp. JEL0797]|nr:hypothetical protein HDU98_010057 [Podochytrium sp. JEL0797]